MVANEQNIEERNALAMRHIQLAHWIINRFYQRHLRHMQYDDLLSAAYIGIVRAAERYDPSRNVKFTVFAVEVVKHFVYQAVYESFGGFKAQRRLRQAKITGTEYEQQCALSICSPLKIGHDPTHVRQIPSRTIRQDELTYRKERKVRIAKVVHALPDHLHEAVQIYYLQDDKEHAKERLGIDQNTLGSRLFQARKILRDRLYEFAND